MEKISMSKLEEYAGFYPVVVSACLLGEPCRHDGKSKPCEAVVEYARTHDVIPVCPEQLGGLPTPRTPSEISGGRVVTEDGENRTTQFEVGAQAVVSIMRKQKSVVAILKENSPSCGVYHVYDGTFTGTLKEGRGITTTVLARNNFTVLSEENLAWNVDAERIKAKAAGQDPDPEPVKRQPKPKPKPPRQAPPPPASE